ncbi:MAG: hypothetical protein NVSMB21_24850 [Vulcanimicrobiaceae bacterium]
MARNVRLHPSRGLALGVAAACIAIALAIALVAPRATRRANVAHGTPVEPPKVAADFVLRDGADRPTHLLAREERVTLLFFGYTHCPDACPLALAALGRAYRSLETAERARVRLVFVTVDPRRDRPAVVRSYVDNFDAHIVGLTGSLDELARVWRAYGVRVDAKTREVGHGDTIFAIDAGRHVAYVYPPDTPAADLAADLHALVR